MKSNLKYKITFEFDQEILEIEINKQVKLVDVYQKLIKQYDFHQDLENKVDLHYIKENSQYLIENDKSLKQFIEGNYSKIIMTLKPQILKSKPLKTNQGIKEMTEKDHIYLFNNSIYNKSNANLLTTHILNKHKKDMLSELRYIIDKLYAGQQDVIPIIKQILLTSLFDKLQYEHKIQCRQCSKSIIGIRFKCNVCLEYDICLNCYVNIEHQQFHSHCTFLIIKDTSFYNQEMNSFDSIPLKFQSLLSSHFGFEFKAKQTMKTTNEFEFKSNINDEAIFNTTQSKNKKLNYTKIDKKTNQSNSNNPLDDKNNQINHIGKTFTNIITPQTDLFEKHITDKANLEYRRNPNIEHNCFNNEANYIEVNYNNYNYEVTINKTDTCKVIEIPFNTNLDGIKVIFNPKNSSISSSKINIDYQLKKFEFTFTKLQSYELDSKLQFCFEVRSAQDDNIRTKMFTLNISKSNN